MEWHRNTKIRVWTAALECALQISFETESSAFIMRATISNVITRARERKAMNEKEKGIEDETRISRKRTKEFKSWLRFYRSTASSPSLLSLSLFCCPFLSLPRCENFAFIFSRRKERGSRIGASLRPQTFQKSCKVTDNNFLRYVSRERNSRGGRGKSL